MLFYKERNIAFSFEFISINIILNNTISEFFIYIFYEIGSLQAASNGYLSNLNKMHWSLLKLLFVVFDVQMWPVVNKVAECTLQFLN